MNKMLNTADMSGTDYLGRGINILNAEVDARPLLGQAIMIDLAGVTETNINDTGKNTISEQSYISFLKEFSASLGIEYRSKKFTGDVQTKFSTENFESVKTNFAEVNVIHEGKNLRLDPAFNHLKGFLSTEFIAALADSDPDTIFASFGTHVSVSLNVGGMLRYFANSRIEETMNKEKFSIDAEAKYDEIFFSVNGSGSVDKRKQEEASHVQSSSTFQVLGGSAGASANVIAGKPDSITAWINSLADNPGFLGFEKDGLIPIWKLASGSKAIELETAFKIRFAKEFDVAVLSQTGDLDKFSKSTVTVDDDYKLLCGGAVVNWVGDGCFLTASYPQSTKSWEGRAKEHGAPSNSKVTAYALAVYDPFDIWEIKHIKHIGRLANKPTATVRFADADGWTLVGGGATVDWVGPGNLLTESSPTLKSDGVTPYGWQAKAKDHKFGGQATVTCYAIGIKSKLSGVTVTSHVTQAKSIPSDSPSQSVDVGDRTMVGGGATVNYLPTQPGNLLTASAPISPTTWIANSKDHLHGSSGTITAYAIGVEISDKVDLT